MASPAGLMDLDVYIPTFSCSLTFNLNEQNKGSRMKLVAEFITDVYSKCSKCEADYAKFSDIDLNPDRKPCIGLRQALIENVEQDIKIYKSATLQTDSSPKYTLKKVTESLSNGILFVNSFPLYSETSVTVLKSEIKVEMRFNRDF